MRKKLLWGMLCAAALVCTSCQGANPDKAGAPPAAFAKTEISWAVCVDREVADAEAVCSRLAEQIPEAALTFIPISRSLWKSRISAIVASGEIPDILYRDGQALVASYAQQGIICALPYDIVREYAPNLYQAALDYGKETWLATQVNGKNYGLPIIQPDMAAPYSDHWRLDMLKKLGIEQVPRTLDEAEEAFSRAVKADLNGSGKNDTYGLSFRGKDQTEYLFSSIFAAYGALPGSWMLKDGQLVFGMMKEEEVRDALTRLADWYQKGYIDPGFVTTDLTTYSRKAANGNMLMNCGAAAADIFPPDGDYVKLAKEQNPKAELVPGPPLMGPEGTCGYLANGKATSSLTFGSQLEEEPEKLRLCLRVIDFLAADHGTAEYVLYGEKGVDWEQNPQTNAYQSLDPLALDSRRHIGSYLTGVPARQERYRHPQYAAYSLYTSAGTLHPEQDYITWAGAFANADIYAVKAEADRDFQRDVIDIIAGVLPVDAYSASRENWYNQGGAWVTEEMNRAYQLGKLQLDEIYTAIS